MKRVYHFAADPAPAGLERIYFADEQGDEYAANATAEMRVGETKPLRVRGELRSGEEVDLDSVPITFAVSGQAAATDFAGMVTARQTGAAMFTAQAALPDGRVLKTGYLWIRVSDPNEFLDASYVASTSLSHPRMTAEIGQPAVIRPGDVYPTVTVRSNVEATVELAVYRDGGTPVLSLPPVSFREGEAQSITVPGTADAAGLYEMRLRIVEPGKPAVYDAFHFAALEPDAVPAKQTAAAFMNEDGQLTYVPDYKGNRILDFSNSGYMGGGVNIPDVPVVRVIEPIDGDNTAHIQAAINETAKLPLSPDGFRGAILLKKGVYPVYGTIYIRDGGIVLRGEGDGEGGTTIHGAGNKARNLIEVGSGAGAVADEQTAVDIAELYVPSGSRTFHVIDASGYEPGDTVFVRRIGSSRWISEIGMDHIYMRPGSGGTTQWSPFNLDFDRVVTSVDKANNRITVDAPIANAIDRKWGGGQLLKYDDAARIQQVGVEWIRVDSDFDKSVTSTVWDNGKTDPYYADENHAERFVVFKQAKNGWVRHVTACHLSYSLAEMGSGAKWITVQDCRVYDMVSIITGGRRYAIFFKGQLNLAQRIYVETARHAFVVDSRVAGPNVVLDSESALDYNTSEPHHRWSTGGLFDNVRSPISIRDRAWLGSGHGWAGANYVAWNTEGNLTVQQPPTAQNYAIGHVGPKVPGLVPNGYDSRPRNDGFWDVLGEHANPHSLYKQQLKERLGQQAVNNIKPSKAGRPGG